MAGCPPPTPAVRLPRQLSAPPPARRWTQRKLGQQKQTNVDVVSPTVSFATTTTLVGGKDGLAARRGAPVHAQCASPRTTYECVHVLAMAAWESKICGRRELELHRRRVHVASLSRGQTGMWMMGGDAATTYALVRRAVQSWAFHVDETTLGVVHVRRRQRKRQVVHRKIGRNNEALTSRERHSVVRGSHPQPH